MAARFGCTEWRVRSSLMRAGVKPRPPAMPTPLRLAETSGLLPPSEQLAAEYLAGATLTALQDRYGVSRWVIRSRVKAAVDPAHYRRKERHSAEVKHKARLAFAAGDDARDVARRLGVKLATVEQWQRNFWKGGAF